MTLRVRVSGIRETRAAFERLQNQSPAAARRAVNRTVGVARKRVIRAVARKVGVPQSVIGGRQGSRRRNVKGRGYIKQIKASRFRAVGGLVALIEGIRFSKLRRKRLGRSARKPGGLGEPFRGTMRSGFQSLFERVPPQVRVSRGASAGTQRKNLPIREVVIPIEPFASRAVRTIMRRVARTVYPAKIWQELQKFMKRAR